MKIAIFGAGAIGGYLGAKLHQAGADVRLIARGAHRDAIRTSGLTLKSGADIATVEIPCTDNTRELGPQDFVIVAVKAYALGPAAADIAALLGPHSTLVTAINGIPYWYFYKDAPPWRNRILESVDPGGFLWRTLPPEHVLGCVLYPSGELTAPGVIHHLYGTRVILGEPDGSMSARATALAGAFSQAGLEAPVSPRIRDDLWLKLWGNLAFNPLSVLTGETLDRLASEPELRAAARAMMLEAEEVAHRLGIRFSVDVERRIAMTGEVGAHRTSMLQDFERGRPLELDAMLGAIVELGAVVDVAMPECRRVLAAVRERVLRRDAASGAG